MENELETYNREEEEKLKESEKLLKHMQSRIREEEMTVLREGKASSSSLGHRNDHLDDSGIFLHLSFHLSPSILSSPSLFCIREGKASSLDRRNTV